MACADTVDSRYCRWVEGCIRVGNISTRFENPVHVECNRPCRGVMSDRDVVPLPVIDSRCTVHKLPSRSSRPVKVRVSCLASVHTEGGMDPPRAVPHNGHPRVTFVNAT